MRIVKIALDCVTLTGYIPIINNATGARNMDSAHKSDRKFPAYTTAELIAAAIRETDPKTAAELNLEIARRQSGTSKPFVTPQL